jgi:protein TonB
MIAARVRAGTTVLLSVAVHLGLIWTLLANPDSFGLSPRPSEAISENPYETIVLEAIHEEEERTAPSENEAVSQPTPEIVDRPEPQIDEKPPVEEKQVKEATEEREPDRTADLAAPPKDDPEPEVLVPLKKEERSVEVPLKVEPPRKEPAKTTAKKQIKKQTNAPQTRSAPSSRSADPGKGKSGATTASTGAVLTYASRVRAKIAANKPSGNGARGRVTVAFGVTLSGGLSHVRIARSSGSGALDQAAMSAVRRAAPFGQPPAGASARQLAFSIPITFE